MDTKQPLELIKKVVLEEAKKLGVRVEKIILFGSRAVAIIGRTVTTIYW